MPTGNAPSHVCYLGVSQALPPPVPRALILLSFSLLVTLLEPNPPPHAHIFTNGNTGALEMLSSLSQGHVPPPPGVNCEAFPGDLEREQPRWDGGEGG